MQEIVMIKYLKYAAAILAAFVVVGAVLTFLGLPRQTAASPVLESALSISPEEITRAAAAMPVHQVQHYHNEKLD
jgi:hypothetical protein